MRTHEITHPHTTMLRIEPEQFYDFQRLTSARDEVRLIRCDDSDPDMWTLHIACVSDDVACRMEEGWA